MACRVLCGVEYAVVMSGKDQEGVWRNKCFAFGRAESSNQMGVTWTKDPE